jgi:hypothetical protein
VFARYEPDALVLQQERKRIAVPKADVVGLDTVRDRVRTFLADRDRSPNHVRHQWYVADWARSHGLPAMARLQAMAVLRLDPDHEAAHELLGHKRVGKRWLWSDGEHSGSLVELDRMHAEWGSAWYLESEHYRVHSNAPLDRLLDVLFDLERFHQHWYEQFGEALRLYEVVGGKLLVHVWRDVGGFSPLSSDKHPYFRHRIESVTDPAACFTYFLDASAARPLRLFEVVTQNLFYRTVTDDPALDSAHRRCGFGEVGVATWLERTFAGPAGRAAPVRWQVDPGGARLVLRDRSVSLVNLLHRSVRQFHFVVADDTAMHWAAAQLFTAYALQDPELRGRYCAWLVAAIRDAKGEGSSEFDKRMGRTAESLEEPWRRWIAEQVAAAPL